MSWHFSRVLVEAYSGESCLGGRQFAPWKLIPTARDDSCSAKMKATFHRSLYGMMFVPSTDDLGRGLLTWFREVFLAKISPVQELGKVLPEKSLGCGRSLQESLAKFAPDGSLLKTAQCSHEGGLELSSVIWPRWGMMRDGECWELTKWEPPTKEIGFGSWPTPDVRGFTNKGSLQKLSKTVKNQDEFNRMAYRASVSRKKAIWLTPCAQESGINVERLIPIKGGVLGGMNRHLDKNTGRVAQIGLTQQVKLRQRWPTPTVSDSKPASMVKVTEYRQKNRRTTVQRLRAAATEPEQVGGSLNPNWVELLMGWPVGWSCVCPISGIYYLQWLMETNSAEETRTNEVLRILRVGNVSKELSKKIGRPVSISQAAILLSILCEYKDRLDQARIFLACAKTLEEEMRSVRPTIPTSGPPCQPDDLRQWCREHSDFMQVMPRLLAHFGKEAWKNGSWENALPRIITGLAHRVDRLRAIGNGQVPEVAIEQHGKC
jgi:hypothetical protein